MRPAGGGEFRVIKRLHSHADAINASGEPSGGFLRANGFRVSLQRHFLEAAGKRGAKRVENSSYLRGIEQARCSTADVNRVHGCQWPRILASCQFSADS